MPAADLKATGNATLKSGAAAVLHEFAAPRELRARPRAPTPAKQLKPYMDFIGGPPRTVFRNWDLVVGNYAVGGPVGQIDRGADVLR